MKIELNFRSSLVLITATQNKRCLHHNSWDHGIGGFSKLDLCFKILQSLVQETQSSHDILLDPMSVSCKVLQEKLLRLSNQQSISECEIIGSNIMPRHVKMNTCRVTNQINSTTHCTQQLIVLSIEFS